MASTLVDHAAEVARFAHRGQEDKAGQPYFRSHVCDVVRRIPRSDEDARAVAYLHDVLEDTDATSAQLADVFPPYVVEAVEALTHRPHEPRTDYYARVKTNPLALRVKLADIASNTDPERTALLDDDTRARLAEKYRKALATLSG